ncbi:MAG: hypothetical protein R3C19_13915 [Planctomycetaceae bacterium]
MNMNRLRLFNPSAREPDVENASDEPSDILPFRPRSRTTVVSGRMFAPVDRARIIHDNGQCPECSHTDVEPLELEDALISPKSRLPIPGTATIVGFHCHHCGTEWPVYEISTRRV